jgi:hypothetical protein
MLAARETWKTSALLRANQGTVDMNEVREYFRCSMARNCSMSSSEKSIDAPIVAGGGVTAPETVLADPCQALDELMAVLEELCPVWPPRPTFSNESNYRL